MKVQSKLLEEVVEAFAEFPGIGRKSALRMALFLLNESREKRAGIRQAISRMDEIHQCKQCFNLSDSALCSICTDKSRNQAMICVVESIQDVMAIEETGQYQGVYHVLGGVISPIEGIGPDDIKVAELMERTHNPEISEVIMAISPTIDGETTIYYISKKLENSPIKVSQIARGVSFGGELQYTDEITLGRSIIARVPYALNGL